ncbi:MAG: flagellar basal body P-ring formation chaperone FlgA [Bryobacteraceae bacterium]
MTLRCLVALLWLARFAPAQAPKCLAVEGEHIVAGDLAASLPAFGQLDPETPVALTPMPGVRRVFRWYELAALAKRYGLEAGSPSDACFERKMENLDRDKVLEEMRRTLALKDARIEIVETSADPVPRGRLEFRREDLGRPALLSSPTPVTWRGSVIYGDNHRFSIWARVAISARQPRVVAAEYLKRGEPIGAAQIRVETVEGFPVAGEVAQSIEEVAGREMSRDLVAGSEIRVAQLIAVPDVSRGEMVDVEVRSGAARLLLTGKAESSGRSGDMIAIRNMTSNKLFQARITGKGKALLDAGRAHGN